MDSLLGAVGAFIGGMAGLNTYDTTQTSPPAWADSLKRLNDKPVIFDVPQNQGIGSIRDHDPEFDLAEFLVRVGQMFSAYHEALDRGDLKPVRRFVEETAYMRLETAVTKTGRNPNGPLGLKVHAIRPITAKHEDDLDLVRVFISAEQAGTDEMLCEYWELVRKRGTLTKHGLDLTHCPNCGGPVDGLDPTRCAYCDTRLADPALDWVVRKITAQ
jgi:predicted lipid-binding transport protein (Tim44 family)